LGCKVLQVLIGLRKAFLEFPESSDCQGSLACQVHLGSAATKVTLSLKRESYGVKTVNLATAGSLVNLLMGHLKNHRGPSQ